MDNSKTTGPILYYDGVCNLCNRSVQFIIRHDKKQIFTFESLQSEKGKIVLANFQGTPPDSVIVYQNNKYYIKSDAILRIMKIFGGIWLVPFAFVLIPRFFRDKVYDFIARHRYKWFGKTATCQMLPTVKNL